MFKLKLKNALSYSGIVSADTKNPIVELKTRDEADEAAATGYFDIVEEPAKKQDPPPIDDTFTAASLKKLNADQQKEIIVQLGGDLETVNNEEERVALILALQEENKADKE